LGSGCVPLIVDLEAPTAVAGAFFGNGSGCADFFSNIALRLATEFPPSLKLGVDISYLEVPLEKKYIYIRL
jgi:hypothetical protein